jgi:hypothetical protein
MLRSGRVQEVYFVTGYKRNDYTRPGHKLRFFKSMNAQFMWVCFISVSAPTVCHFEGALATEKSFASGEDFSLRSK